MDDYLTSSKRKNWMGKQHRVMLETVKRNVFRCGNFMTEFQPTVLISLLSVLLLFMIVVFAVGMIRPQMVLFFRSKRTRGQVFLIYGLPSLLIFFSLALLAPPIETPQNIQSATAQDNTVNTSPPDLRFQKPSEFQDGTAEKALAEYVAAWKNKDWNRMTAFTQASWKERQINPAQMLAGRYEFMEVKGFEITNSLENGSTMKKIEYTLYLELTLGQIERKNYEATVIKENVSGKDIWGVNPLSIREQ